MRRIWWWDERFRLFLAVVVCSTTAIHDGGIYIYSPSAVVLLLFGMDPLKSFNGCYGNTATAEAAERERWRGHAKRGRQAEGWGTEVRSRMKVEAHVGVITFHLLYGGRLQIPCGWPGRWRGQRIWNIKTRHWSFCSLKVASKIVVFGY